MFLYRYKKEAIYPHNQREARTRRMSQEGSEPRTPTGAIKRPYEDDEEGGSPPPTPKKPAGDNFTIRARELCHEKLGAFKAANKDSKSTHPLELTWKIGDGRGGPQIIPVNAKTGKECAVINCTGDIKVFTSDPDHKWNVKLVWPPPLLPWLSQIRYPLWPGGVKGSLLRD